MRWKVCFVSLVSVVEEFVCQKSLYYRIDPSHNLHHSLQVRELGFLIADRDYYLNKQQKEILYLSCMLHDMCDSKYTPCAQSILDVSNFLKKKCGVSMMTHDAVVEIITSMSYSQIVKQDGKVEYPRWLSSDRHGWGTVFHIVRQSDLLTSYDLKRMIHYKHEKLNILYSCDLYVDILDTVGVRMNRLLERNLFHSPTAIKIAEKWHRELCREVDILAVDDIYPLFYKPLETLPHFRQRILDAL